MKLWAWLIMSSQKPLTKVSGYRRWILGIIINNFIPRKKEETYSDFKNHPGDMQLKLPIEWLRASKAIIHICSSHLLHPLFCKWLLALASEIARVALIWLAVGFTTGCRKSNTHNWLHNKYTFINIEQSESFKDSDYTLILPDSHSDCVSLRSLLSPTNWQMEKRRHPLWQA